MAIHDEDVVKSVGRVFEVLQLFDARRASLNATQVERSLGYPQSSTLALLKSMVRLGYLSFDRLQRSYLPTMRVSTLGRWLEASFRGDGRLSALLEEVSSRTSETACLSCQNDLVMQFTHVHFAGKGLILGANAGDFAPLFQSAVGLAALSVRSDPETLKLVQRHNRRIRNPAGKIDADAVLQRIRQVQTVGYATGYDLSMPEIGAIAWVLRSEGAPCSVVLSVGGPSDRLRSREAIIVRQTHAAIRAHLGG
jgi:DNA-binding IclR family transcriptional regulator